MNQSDCIVIIPTYNEKENIEKITRAVFGLEKCFHILVIDDGSPDGTAAIVKRLMATEFADRLFLLERSGKLGLGTAYIAGFKWALQHDYEELQMAAFKDKDNQLSFGFSNAPDGSDIPRDSIIQIVDLLNSALEAKTSNVFKLLRYIFSKTQGDLVELVKFKEEMFDANTVTSYTSNLAFNREFSKIDLIRVFRAIYDLRMIISRDGQDLSLDEYFNTLGDLLDYKLSDANKYFSNSIGEGCSEATITAIFDTLAQALLNKSVRKIG